MSPAPPREPPGDGWIDWARLTAVAADCDWSPAELGRFYVDGIREQLSEISAALAAGEAAEVERLAHGCVGSSATCGITGMTELFGRLEVAAGRGELAGCEPLLAAAEARFKATEERLGELAAGE